MDHKLTTKRVSTIRRVGWLSVAAMLALALLAPAANAGHGVTVVTSVQDPRLDGNPSCSAQGNAEQGIEDWYGGGQDWVEFKIDATAFVDDHVYDVDGEAGSKTITLDFVDANTINWSSNFGIDAVFVKTGSGNGGYNTLYVYAPTAGHAEAMSGQVGNGGPTGISHLSFCYDVNDPTTSTTTTSTTSTTSTTTSSSTTTTATSSTTTASTTTSSTTTGSTTTASTTTSSTTTPSQNVLSETGTPSVTLPPTDALSGSSAPSGDSWRLFLAAMAVLLASVLVMTPAKAASRRR